MLRVIRMDRTKFLHVCNNYIQYVKNYFYIYFRFTYFVTSYVFKTQIFLFFLILGQPESFERGPKYG